MTSWAIVALGVALLVLAIALATVRGGGRTWVVGVGHVHSASEPPTQYAFGRCELQLVIDAPGLPPRSKKIIEPRVPVAKWPSLGQTLPIRVALDDQRHVRVLWDEVPTHAETAAAACADLPPEYADADAAGRGADPAGGPAVGRPWAGRRLPRRLRRLPRRPGPGRRPARRPRTDPLDDPLRDDPGVAARGARAGGGAPAPGRPGGAGGHAGRAAGAGRLPRRATPPAPPPSRRRATRRRPVRHRAGGRPSTPTPRPPTAGGRRPTGRADPDRPTDPPDPVDVPLDDPHHRRAAAPVDRRGLDEAIFGSDRRRPTPATTPAAPDQRRRASPCWSPTWPGRSTSTATCSASTRSTGAPATPCSPPGTTRLVLREVTGAAPISRRLVHVNLEVDDIEAVYERLRGLRASGSRTRPGWSTGAPAGGVGGRVPRPGRPRHRPHPVADPRRRPARRAPLSRAGVSRG